MTATEGSPDKRAVLDRFIAELVRDANVAGVFLFGSFARGESRPDSDIDLLVIARGAFHREIVRREGVEFEVFFNNPDDTITFWRDNPDDFAGFWRDARVLFDRDGTVRHLQEVGATLA